LVGPRLTVDACLLGALGVRGAEEGERLRLERWALRMSPKDGWELVAESESSESSESEPERSSESSEESSTTESDDEEAVESESELVSASSSEMDIGEAESRRRRRSRDRTEVPESDDELSEIDSTSESSDESDEMSRTVPAALRYDARSASRFCREIRRSSYEQRPLLSMKTSFTSAQSSGPGVQDCSSPGNSDSSFSSSELSARLGGLGSVAVLVTSSAKLQSWTG
jgi:hypothetical protein